MTPQQAQELAELIDELASVRADQKALFWTNDAEGGAVSRDNANALRDRLAKLLESVHAG